MDLLRIFAHYIADDPIGYCGLAVLAGFVLCELASEWRPTRRPAHDVDTVKAFRGDYD